MLRFLASPCSAAAEVKFQLQEVHNSLKTASATVQDRVGSKPDHSE